MSQLPGAYAQAFLKSAEISCVSSTGRIDGESTGSLERRMRPADKG
jgi:hypothetical protein